jgi:hypothetical protein
MQARYHREITVKALSTDFVPAALEAVITANLGQDHLFRGQIGHPEYHFDDNCFSKGQAYMEENRSRIRPALEAGDAVPAQQALGRLTHAGQDLYAHSNYISLWLNRLPTGIWPDPDEIEAFDRDLLQGTELHSGKIYWPLEPLSWLPMLKKTILPRLPRDSHAWMNLDGPEQGPLFPYAVAAAVKRTRYEFELAVQGLPAELLFQFCGKNLSPHEV